METLERIACESCGSTSFKPKDGYLSCENCGTKYKERIQQIKNVELPKKQKETIKSNMSDLKVSNCIIMGNMNDIKGNYNIVIGDMNDIKGIGNIATGNMNTVKEKK